MPRSHLVDPREDSSIFLDRRERLYLSALLVLAACVRTWLALHVKANTDEMQHLHVAYGWTRGWVQYRDLSDNHAPLFHLLIAPLLALFDEEGSTLIAMRLLMIPLALFSIYAVYAIVVAMGLRPYALAAAAAATFEKSYLRCSIEFRADCLWAALWFASVAILLSSRWSERRVFFAAILLGAAQAASIKTVLLSAALIIAVAATACVRRDDREGRSLRQTARIGISAALGFVVVPALVAVFFAFHGALDELWLGAVLHNSDTRLETRGFRGLLFIFPVLAAAAYLTARASIPAAIARRRVFVVVVTGSYFLLWQSLSPIVNSQDRLPFIPLAVACVFSFLASLFRRAAVTRFPRLSHATPLLLAFGYASASLIALATTSNLDRSHLFATIRRIDLAVMMTDRDDYVMDPKGDFVFRRRAFFPVLERVASTRIAEDPTADLITEGLLRHGVALVLDRTYPPKARAFIEENYLRSGGVLVAGRRLDPIGSSDDTAFEIVIPGIYDVVADGGVVTGRLDGAAYTGPVKLARGPHRWSPSPDPARPTRPTWIVWSRALECGFRPATF